MKITQTLHKLKITLVLKVASLCITGTGFYWLISEDTENISWLRWSGKKNESNFYQDFYIHEAGKGMHVANKNILLAYKKKSQQGKLESMMSEVTKKFLLQGL